jgi:speckle-type POZ protein
MVQHLLAIADLYNLDRLKLLCESDLCKAISIATVATILSLAEQHHCPQLKAICIKFTGNPENLGAVMKSEAFRHLEESCPSLLSELLATFASMDENSNSLLGWKRSSSSLLDLDLATDGAKAKSANPNGRRMRRRL